MFGMYLCMHVYAQKSALEARLHRIEQKHTSTCVDTYMFRVCLCGSIVYLNSMRDIERVRETITRISAPSELSPPPTPTNLWGPTM